MYGNPVIMAKFGKEALRLRRSLIEDIRTGAYARQNPLGDAEPISTQDFDYLAGQFGLEIPVNKKGHHFDLIAQAHEEDGWRTLEYYDPSTGLQKLDISGNFDLEEMGIKLHLTPGLNRFWKDSGTLDKYSFLADLYRQGPNSTTNAEISSLHFLGPVQDANIDNHNCGLFCLLVASAMQKLTP
ncbi:MAG: hypothetical protein JW727_04105 [Candidatus Aenigmarchaeota archaeon]|nr:hypothetical protein [Candidatus Aenigmarchaeota archaeon]